MNSKRDFDRAVDQWLDEGSDVTPPETIDAVLLAVRSTPQERDFQVPWRTTSMTSYLRVAAVIALAVIGSTAALLGYQFVSGGPGFGGTNATPSPSPVLLTRGNFVIPDGAVEVNAIAQGSSVTGGLTVSLEGAAFTVDLQCTRTTEDGLILIGGVTAESTIGAISPEGTWAAIVLERGSPVKANIWSQRGGPTSEAPSCLAFLDEQLMMEECCRNSENPPVWLSPIEGTVEFGP